MEFEQMIKKINLTSKEDNIEVVAEVFENVMIMDNMSNIERILLNNSEAMIKNISLKNGKFVLKGILKIDILYLGENENLASVNKNIEFYVNLGEGEKWDKIFNLKANILNIETEVVKKRRIEVNANIKISGICIVPEDINVMNESNIEGLEIKSTKDVCSIFDTNSTKETFSFKKDIPLSDNINILFAYAKLRDINTNASGVGVLYSAKVEIILMYQIGFEDESDIKIEKLIYPINHFIEKDPKLKCDYYNVCANIEHVSAEYIMNDEDSYIEIKMDLISNTLFCEEKEVNLVEDAYSTLRNASPVLSEHNIVALKNNFERKVKINNSKTLVDTDMIGGVIGNTEGVDFEYSLNDNILSVSGNVVTQFVTYIDNESRYFVDSINVPFELKEEIESPCDKDLFVNVNINNLVVTSLNQTINVDGELMIDGYVLGSYDVRDLSNIESLEGKEDNTENIKIKVYYKEKNESLWDIGKKNLIKVDTLLDINNIESEEDLPDCYPLIIK
ncbi:DUF3794 domain-containing protein [Anaerofustis sp.]|uniref:DUF3794 domain-containing protein n=1 Tax=Anaerofustis sp. TaxID=1872517 RepID=UPI0025BD6AEF|nr:DUF3794 domain-containing protein [Anaerofustis sp.]